MDIKNLGLYMNIATGQVFYTCIENDETLAYVLTEHGVFLKNSDKVLKKFELDKFTLMGHVDTEFHENNIYYNSLIEQFFAGVFQEIAKSMFTNKGISRAGLNDETLDADVTDALLNTIIDMAAESYPMLHLEPVTYYGKIKTLNAKMKMGE